jgi:hypothetical protein
MSIGYNSKVQVADGLYDVQTEERGAAHPFIDTVVLLSGQVLHKRSVDYSDLLVAGAADPETLRDRVERQHLDVLAALRSGTLSLQPIVSPGNAIQVKLLNSATWLANGKVALEIQVRTRSDGHAVAGADVDAEIEGASGGRVRYGGKSDAEGRVRLEFAFPQLLNATAAALVISAHAGRVQDRLRYSLKPAPPSKGSPSL